MANWRVSSQSHFSLLTHKVQARSTIDEVNAVWKGLGYHSRASRLLSGAQKVVDQYNGILPDNAKDMEANMPGIGRYSAGAICSIAYGEKVPVVCIPTHVFGGNKINVVLRQLDGNVHRLLSRILALHAPPKAKMTLDILWTAATALVKTDGKSFALVSASAPDCSPR